MLLRDALPSLDWVIAGGESGPGARPMHVDWVRGIRDQCAAAGTAFFFKQWGEWLPINNEDDDGWQPADGGARGRFEGVRVELKGDYPNQFAKVGKKRAGRLLDGLEHNEYPA